MYASLIIRTDRSVEADFCGEGMCVDDDAYLDNVRGFMKRNGLNGDWAIIFSLDLATMTKGKVIKEFFYTEGKVIPGRIKLIAENIKPEQK